MPVYELGRHDKSGITIQVRATNEWNARRLAARMLFDEAWRDIKLTYCKMLFRNPLPKGHQLWIHDAGQLGPNP